MASHDKHAEHIHEQVARQLLLALLIACKTLVAEWLKWRPHKNDWNIVGVAEGAPWSYLPQAAVFAAGDFHQTLAAGQTWPGPCCCLELQTDLWQKPQESAVRFDLQHCVPQCTPAYNCRSVLFERNSLACMMEQCSWLVCNMDMLSYVNTWLCWQSLVRIFARLQPALMEFECTCVRPHCSSTLAHGISGS